MKEIRQYNCLFTFTSMEAQIDRSVNDGCGPPVFKICGQVHHRIGSLVPPDDGPPKFIQLYIYDTTNEIRNRLHSLDAEDSATRSLSPSVVNTLIQMLGDHNSFVNKLRTARERLQEHPQEDFIIRIVGAREGDTIQYNLPTTDDLAMLIVGDTSLEIFKCDIIIETRNKELKRISELHPAYMTLQYPLLFLYGKRGFQVGVLYNGVKNRNFGERARTNMSMQEYYCYQFHYRPKQPNPYLCYDLSSQAKVDARACLDENRLRYILNNQGNLCTEHFQGITDDINRGCTRGDEIGKAIILPASHTEGRRYMI
jgi:hypothetical protein